MTARRQGASSSGTRRPGASAAGRRPSAPASASRRTAGATGSSRPDPQKVDRISSAPQPAAGADTTGPVWGLTKRTLILTVVVVIAIASVLPYLNAWIRQQQELSRLRDQVVAQEQTVADLEVEVDRWEDPVYVMAQARERLLYALPGESQYRLTDTSGAEVPQSADSFESEAAAAGDWFSTLWTSVQAADDAAPGSAQDAGPALPTAPPTAPAPADPTTEPADAAPEPHLEDPE